MAKTAKFIEVTVTSSVLTSRLTLKEIHKAVKQAAKKAEKGEDWRVGKTFLLPFANGSKCFYAAVNFRDDGYHGTVCVSYKQEPKVDAKWFCTNWGKAVSFPEFMERLQGKTRRKSSKAFVLETAAYYRHWGIRLKRFARNQPR